MGYFALDTIVTTQVAKGSAVRWGAGILLCLSEMESCCCFGGVTTRKDYRILMDQREGSKGQMEMLSTTTFLFL